MNETCRFEHEVVAAASTGEWSDALREHVTSCSDCDAAAAIAPWMLRFERVRDREHMLPDPTVLWLKAQLMRSTQAASRAALPIRQAQVIAFMVVAAGWAALLTFRWEAMQNWVHAVTPSGMMQAATASAMSSSFLLTVLVLGSMTIALAVHAILADD